MSQTPIKNKIAFNMANGGYKNLDVYEIRTLIVSICAEIDAKLVITDLSESRGIRFVMKLPNDEIVIGASGNFVLCDRKHYYGDNKNYCVIFDVTGAKLKYKKDLYDAKAYREMLKWLLDWDLIPATAEEVRKKNAFSWEKILSDGRCMNKSELEWFKNSFMEFGRRDHPSHHDAFRRNAAA